MLDIPDPYDIEDKSREDVMGLAMIASKSDIIPCPEGVIKVGNPWLRDAIKQLPNRVIEELLDEYDKRGADGKVEGEEKAYLESEHY